jgi:hypothetical protein
MANARVFTGADGSITLSTPQGAEGTAAQAVIDTYQLLSVGRVFQVKVEIHSDVKEFHEIGQRYATELRTGNVHIQGTIGRAYINGALLRLLLGSATDARPATSWVQPAFNITILLENVANPGVRNTLTLHEVKIVDWVFDIPEDDFSLEEVHFKALYATNLDEEGS